MKCKVLQTFHEIQPPDKSRSKSKAQRTGTFVSGARSVKFIIKINLCLNLLILFSLFLFFWVTTKLDLKLIHFACCCFVLCYWNSAIYYVRKAYIEAWKEKGIHGFRFQDCQKCRKPIELDLLEFRIWKFLMNFKIKLEIHLNWTELNFILTYHSHKQAIAMVVQIIKSQ